VQNFLENIMLIKAKSKMLEKSVKFLKKIVAEGLEFIALCMTKIEIL